MSDHIDISSDQFQFGIDVFLATVVINSNPTSNISFGFVAVKGYRVIRFPRKSCCSIGNFAVDFSWIFTENLPIQSGNRKKSIRKRRELNGINVIEDINSIFSLDDVTIVEAKEFACNSFGLFCKSNEEFDIFLNVLLKERVFID
jgi:hypothetical protein